MPSSLEIRSSSSLSLLCNLATSLFNSSTSFLPDPYLSSTSGLRSGIFSLQAVEEGHFSRLIESSSESVFTFEKRYSMSLDFES